MPYGHNKTTKRKKSWEVRESKVEHDQTSSERVDLDPKAFDKLILQKGMNCKVYRTMYCPKVKSVDGAEHEIDCTLCNGSGFIDFDPICCKVFIQTQDLEKMPNVEGFVDGNTVLMTFPVGIELQYFTRVELTDFTNIYFQRILRNPDSNTDVLQYKACKVNALVDYDGVRYYADTDFKMNLDGNIMWLDGVQTRLLTFSEPPVAGVGSWSFKVGQGSPYTGFNFYSTSADLQVALRDAYDIDDITVTGDYDAGFVISFPTTKGLIPDLNIASNTLKDADNAFIEIEIENSLTGGRHPANNKPYSIHYEAPQQFRAAAAGHVNRYTQYTVGGKVEFIKMSEQWYCAKEFLPKRLNRAGEELEQGPYDNHKIVEEED